MLYYKEEVRRPRSEMGALTGGQLRICVQEDLNRRADVMVSSNYLKGRTQ